MKFASAAVFLRSPVDVVQNTISISLHVYVFLLVESCCLIEINDVFLLALLPHNFIYVLRKKLLKLHSLRSAGVEVFKIHKSILPVLNS